MRRGRRWRPPGPTVPASGAVARRVRKDDVPRFLTDPAVPFTNNAAEQAARMMKLKRKISAGFRFEQGASDFALIRSLIATAKKQGWNITHTLTQTPHALLENLRTA